MTLNVLIPVVLVALLPGLLIGASAGLRGWLLAAAGPLLTLGLIGAAGSLLPLLGLRWSPIALAGSAVVLSCAVFLCGRLLSTFFPADPPAAEERPHWKAPQHVAVASAVVVSGAVGAMNGWFATRGLTATPQWWDAFWHMNGITFIAESGQSAPSALQVLTGSTPDDFFYPNGFHVLGATAVMLTGASAVAVINAVVVVLPGAFALGLVALLRACRARAALAASAALLACAFTAFPYDVLSWGPLFPFATGVALVPALLALVAAVLHQRGAAPVGLPVALGAGALGALAVHPSVLIAAVVFGAALLVQVARGEGVTPRDLGALAASACAALVLGLPLVVAGLGAAGGLAYDWPADVRAGDAVGAMLTFSHGQAYPQYWLAGLVVLAVLQRRALAPMAWIVVAGALFAGLYVAAASYEGGTVALLTAPWWNDRWRFAALWGMAAVVPAAAGLVVVHDALRSLVDRLRPVPGPSLRRSGIVPYGAGLAVATVLVVATGGLYQERNEARLAVEFVPDGSVDAAEQRTYEELSRLVPAGEKVMNDPNDGSAAMWALAGVRPVFATPLRRQQAHVELDADRKLLYQAFNRIGTDHAVTAAAHRLGVRYAVIGQGFIAGDRHVPGMTGLERAAGLELLRVDGDVRIYRVAG
ncbi:DUF6541 family protein [Pseudonocardia sp. RS010]|uniref:DUF6541 family protein n=1 Tax=Pseudonocardia sp. RS010 TaxID=3385979 RepID=UPI0039A1B168